jgi:hypothetical protein
MGVSGQHHAPAALYPRYPLDRKLGLDTEARDKFFACARDRTLVVQSLVRHCPGTYETQKYSKCKATSPTNRAVAVFMF